MKDYIEERVLELAHYIITTNSTVRAAARKFRVSKFTVHTELVRGFGLQFFYYTFSHLHFHLFSHTFQINTVIKYFTASLSSRCCMLRKL